MSEVNCKQVLTNDSDFRQFVVSSLSELSTHMKILVGEDGTGGRMKSGEERFDQLEGRVSTLEFEGAKRKGFRKAVDLVFLVLAWLFGTLSGAHDWFRFHK